MTTQRFTKGLLPFERQFETIKSLIHSVDINKDSRFVWDKDISIIKRIGVSGSPFIVNRLCIHNEIVIINNSCFPSHLLEFIHTNILINREVLIQIDCTGFKEDSRVYLIGNIANNKHV